MKKIISAVLFCAPLSALAADATVDLTFKGTLTQPTCSAAFTGMAGGQILLLVTSTHPILWAKQTILLLQQLR